MKINSIIKSILCYFFAFVMLLCIPTLSYAEPTDIDRDRLTAFWLQTDPDGNMCNGDYVYEFALAQDITLFLCEHSYNYGDWETGLIHDNNDSFSFWFNLPVRYYFNDGIVSGEVDDYFYPNLYGTLDLSDTNVKSIGSPNANQTHIEAVNLNNCSLLEVVRFSGQKYCSSFNALNCPELNTIIAKDCAFKNLNVQPKGYDVELSINAICNGTVGAQYSFSNSTNEGKMAIYSYGEEDSFIGWYCNGDLISTEMEIEYNRAGKLTACFGGDTDGDGAITMKDAVNISRIALGLMDTDLNVSFLDADCNGVTAIGDAVIIARIVLGL